MTKPLKLFLVFLRKILFFFPFREVSVLVYHSVGDDMGNLSINKKTFEKHIYRLRKKGFYFASLEEIINYIEGRKDLPRKTVALTFDDGYEDIYLNALPILGRYNIPFGVFIISDLIGNKGERTNYLSQQQIDEMIRGGAEIGFHSKSHKNLANIAFEDLKTEVNSRMRFFAYPYGAFSEDVVKTVKEAGYRAAFSVKFGLVRRGDDPFIIRRNVITSDDSLLILDFKTSYAIHWYRKITNLLK
jgi:peptidoglycan/xylan/chitin deacetylase (PgdA/CDA1 family)